MASRYLIIHALKTTISIALFTMHLFLKITLTRWMMIYASFCFAAPVPTNSETATADTNAVLKIFESKLNFHFSGQAKVINYKRELGFQDNLDSLLIEIPATQLSAFLNASPFKDTPFRTDRSLLLGVNDLTWWKPEKVKNFTSGQVYLKGGRFACILIDKDKSNFCRIYLQFGPH